MRVRLVQHRRAILQHGAEGCLAIALIAALWSFMRPWLPAKYMYATGQGPVVTDRANSVITTAPRQNSGRLVQAHIFGIPLSAPLPVVADSTIQVRGIAYAPSLNQSIAILNFNGKPLIARQGTRLPDGGTIIAVGRDRVTVKLNGKLENLMLDLKTTALNGRVTLAQFTRTAGAYDNGPTDNSDAMRNGAMLEIQHYGTSSTAGIRPANSVLPHFQSLQELRGKQAMRRFQKVKPPGN